MGARELGCGVCGRVLRGPSGVAGVFAWSGGMSGWPPLRRGGRPCGSGAGPWWVSSVSGFHFRVGGIVVCGGEGWGGSMFWPSGSEDVIELELRFSASSDVPCL